MVRGRPGNVQKSVMHEQSCFFCLLNLLLFEAAVAVAVVSFVRSLLPL